MHSGGGLPLDIDQPSGNRFLRLQFKRRLDVGGVKIQLPPGQRRPTRSGDHIGIAMRLRRNAGQLDSILTVGIGLGFPEHRPHRLQIAAAADRRAPGNDRDIDTLRRLAIDSAMRP